MISCCGHSFCKSCIEQVERDGKSCPLCNEARFSLMHNKGLERSLRELEVYCTNRKVGCEWVGKLGVLEQHLNSNPEPEKQLEGCVFVTVKCVHANCIEHFQRRFLGNHQTECPKRPFSCDYCRVYESTFEDVAYNHYPVCKCYPLPCPNNCTPDTIERQNLQDHLDKDCPLQVVPCDFQYAGCEAKLPRKDMPAHLAENYSHIILLAVLNQRLAQKNDDMAAKLLEKDEQIERLTKDITDLKQECRGWNLGMKDEMSHLQNGAASLKVELKSSLEMLHHHMRVAPIQIIMTRFNQHQRHYNDWWSDPFYTHPHGYKMCLNVSANGYDNGEGTHVSVYVFLMRGDFDDRLTWPCRGDIIIQLLNQLGDVNHYVYALTLTADRVASETGDYGYGEPQFIAHNELSYMGNCQYLKGNCLKFWVEVNTQ